MSSCTLVDLQYFVYVLYLPPCCCRDYRKSPVRLVKCNGLPNLVPDVIFLSHFPFIHFSEGIKNNTSLDE